MFRYLMVLCLFLCCSVSLIGCVPAILVASAIALTQGVDTAPVVERFSLMSPANEILASGKFFIVPASVMHEYFPCGDGEIDNYLQDNGEIWQAEIAAYLANKGIRAEIVKVQPGDFKEKMLIALKRNGRDGFFNPDTGGFDSSMYRNVRACPFSC